MHRKAADRINGTFPALPVLKINKKDVKYMKLKKGLIVTTIALALVVPTSVFAATSTSTAAVKIRGLFGIDSSKLTSTQLADVQDYANKMAELQKSMLDKMVSNGSMTQEQADAEKAQIDKKLANGDIFAGEGRGFKDKEDFKGNRFDISKLTDDQKNTLLSLRKEQLSLENDLAGILVQQKLITQAQADAIKTKVDAAIASLSTSEQNRLVFGAGMGMGSLNMLHSVTLTDSQKAAITEWTVKSADVQKKIVALYKEAAVITQAQADEMNKNIDARAADPLSFTKMGPDRLEKVNMGQGKAQGRYKSHMKPFDKGSDKDGSTKAKE